MRTRAFLRKVYKICSVFVPEVKEDEKPGHCRSETMYSENVLLYLKIGTAALLLEKWFFFTDRRKEKHTLRGKTDTQFASLGI